MIYHRNDEEEGFSVLVLVHASYRVIMPSPLSKDFTCVLRLGLENYSIMREQRYCFSLSLSLSHTHTHTLTLIHKYIHTYIHASYTHENSFNAFYASHAGERDLRVKKLGDLLKLCF